MKSNKIYISVIVVLAALLIGSLSLNVVLLMKDRKSDPADAAYNASQDTQSTYIETSEKTTAETTEEPSKSAFDPALVGEWVTISDILSISEDGSFIWIQYGIGRDGEYQVSTCIKGYIRDYVMMYTDKYTIIGRQVGPGLPNVAYYTSIDDIPTDEWETGLNEEGYRILLSGDKYMKFIGHYELTGKEYTLTDIYEKK